MSWIGKIKNITMGIHKVIYITLGNYPPTLPMQNASAVHGRIWWRTDICIVCLIINGSRLFNYCLQICFCQELIMSYADFKDNNVYVKNYFHAVKNKYLLIVTYVFIYEIYLKLPCATCIQLNITVHELNTVLM